MFGSIYIRLLTLQTYLQWQKADQRLQWWWEGDEIGQKGGISKGQEEVLGDDGYGSLSACGHRHMLKLNKIYTLKICTVSFILIISQSYKNITCPRPMLQRHSGK